MPRGRTLRGGYLGQDEAAVAVMNFQAGWVCGALSWLVLVARLTAAQALLRCDLPLLWWRSPAFLLAFATDIR